MSSFAVPRSAAALTLALTLVLSVAADKQRCARSYDARAAGAFDGFTREQAKEHAFDYYRACGYACRAMFDTDLTLPEIKASPVCVESHLLSADIDFVDGMDEVIADCQAGAPSSCAWVAANQAAITSHQDAVAIVDAARAAADEPPVRSLIPVNFDDAVAATKQAMATSGYSLDSDATYDFSYGYIPFALPMERGFGYLVYLMRPETTPFSAKVKGWGTDTYFFERFPSPPPGVSVLILDLTLGDADDTSPQVVVSADGGDTGDVRVLVFKVRPE